MSAGVTAVAGWRGLFFVNRHVNIFHLLNLRDDNRVGPFALKCDSIGSHIFTNEGHQLCDLTVIGHLVRDRLIEVAIPGQNGGEVSCATRAVEMISRTATMHFSHGQKLTPNLVCLPDKWRNQAFPNRAFHAGFPGSLSLVEVGGRTN